MIDEMVKNVNKIKDEINTTEHFTARIKQSDDRTKAITVTSERGYMSIPIHHIQYATFGEWTVDIITNYMHLSFWRQTNFFHITFYRSFQGNTATPTPIKRYHVSKTPATCEACKRTFKNKAGLTMHMMRSPNHINKTTQTKISG